MCTQHSFARQPIKSPSRIYTYTRCWYIYLHFYSLLARIQLYQQHWCFAAEAKLDEMRVIFPLAKFSCDAPLALEDELRPTSACLILIFQCRMVYSVCAHLWGCGRRGRHSDVSSPLAPLTFLDTPCECSCAREQLKFKTICHLSLAKLPTKIIIKNYTKKKSTILYINTKTFSFIELVRDKGHVIYIYTPVFDFNIWPGADDDSHGGPRREESRRDYMAHTHTIQVYTYTSIVARITL